MAERALKLLKGFRNIFPIGKPYLALYTGRWYWDQGKHQKAVKTWQDGLEAARRYGVLYEEGLLRVRLGDARKDAPTEQLQHFECAAEIFESMGAIRDLRITQALAEKCGLKL
jgi:hypothetical protein